MSVRGKSWWPRTGRLASLLVLALAAACSHPGAGNRAKDPDLPFHQGAQSDPPVDANPAHDLSQGHGTDQPGPGPAPFNASAAWNLPAGTLLTVRLQESLASNNLDAEHAFTAVIDEPVTVEGNTVMDAGVVAQGRVESARASDVKRDAGYIRLSLDSVMIGGRPIPIQTSSLFARGSARQTLSVSTNKSDSSPASPGKTIRLKKGRRLTFRLTSNLAVPTSTAQSEGENSTSHHD